MGQYCFAFRRLSSVVVCNAVGGRASRHRARGRSTMHGGPVRLRSVRATHRFIVRPAADFWAAQQIEPIVGNAGFPEAERTYLLTVTD